MEVSDLTAQKDIARKHLASVSLQRLLADNMTVFSLQHDQTIGEALKALSKRKILSAPLFVTSGLEDMEAEMEAEPAEPTLLGWVRVFDMTSLLHDLSSTTLNCL